MFYPSLRMAKPSIKLIKDNIKSVWEKTNFQIPKDDQSNS